MKKPKNEFYVWHENIVTILKLSTIFSVFVTLVFYIVSGILKIEKKMLFFVFISAFLLLFLILNFLTTHFVYTNQIKSEIANYKIKKLYKVPKGWYVSTIFNGAEKIDKNWFEIGILLRNIKEPYKEKYNKYYFNYTENYLKNIY